MLQRVLPPSWYNTSMSKYNIYSYIYHTKREMQTLWGIQQIFIIKALHKTFFSKVPTISRVVEQVYELKRGIEKFIRNQANSKPALTFAQKLLACLEHRFPQCATTSPLNRMANYLHPYFKVRNLFFAKCVTKCLNISYVF